MDLTGMCSLAGNSWPMPVPCALLPALAAAAASLFQAAVCAAGLAALFVVASVVALQAFLFLSWH